MKISSEKFVTLAYTLTINGEVAESFDADRPMGFVYGVGALPPSFESSIEGLAEGDTFEFTLEKEALYGEYTEDAIVVLKKSVFEVDGVIDEQVVFEGNKLAMMDNEGNRRIGAILKISDEGVTMDFNHPFAGKALSFVGSVVGVREATEAELNPSCGGGCCGGGCGDGDCGDGCGCGDSDCEGGCCH